MASITRVTLLRNTVNDINTATSFDITSEFLGSVTPTIDASAIAYQGANVTRTGLTPGTTYWMWLEVEDGAGNVTVQVLGSIETAAPTVWEFFVSVLPPTGEVWLFSVDSSFGDSVVIPGSTWKLYYHSSDRNRNATPYHFTSNAGLASSSDYVYSQSLGVGDLMWTMIDPSRNNSASFTVNWARPQNVPGLTIKRNGVVVYTDTSAGSTDYEPHEYPITYTIP
jgi:hypothetical protein